MGATLTRRSISFIRRIFFAFDSRVKPEPRLVYNAPRLA